MVGELNEQQMNNLLSSQVVGRLACTDSVRPYLVPVNYVYDGNYIYAQTSEGMKLDLLRNNPNVCFEVDAMTNMDNWQSVIIRGSFEELGDAAAEHARGVLKKKLFTLLTNMAIDVEQQEAGTVPAENNKVKNVLYRIAIIEKTGRFEKR